MSKDKFYEEWSKPQWHRLRKWAEKKNSGEFVIVIDSGLPIRIKSKVEQQVKDEYTEITVRHSEVDLTRESNE